MRYRHIRMGTLAVMFALVAVACGAGENPAVNGGSSGAGRTLPRPSFPAGSTMATIQGRGKLIVGTKFDQPGFGQKNPTTGKVEGFDVEIAKLMAAAVFGGSAADAESKIDFVEAVSKNREPFISDGKVDVVVATYTINDARKQVVDFAGPYFVARQDIMVKADDSTIKGIDDLNAKKVCTAQGSTSEKNLRARAPQAEVLLFPTYSACAEALTDGRVVAVTTDNAVLAGLVNASDRKFKLVGNPFSDEPYGLGMKKGANDWRAFLNDRLRQIYASGEWAKAYEATLGRIGLATPEPPAIDAYQ